MPNTNDKRIAKNAVYLYGRMMLTIFISLYTSRMVLDVLGVSDYGIYNVVGGIVTILAFLNGTMTMATSRFISYELGAGNPVKLQKTFAAALTVHAIIAVIFLLLTETVGLWYVNHQLVIAPERMVATNWTYQFSIIAASVTLFQLPYVATILSHEHMGYYAFVAIVNVLLKLAIIIVVKYCATGDNLIFYAGLFLLASLAVAGMYIFYSRAHFKEARWTLRNTGTIVKSLLKFCSLDVFGNLAYTTRVQGMLVILNRFGGTVLNAAGGLCLTVNSTINSFACSVITAFRPQIIQQYAKANYEYMLKLLNNCARFTLLLLGLLIIPLIIGMESLLGYWLVEIPPYTAIFCQLSLISICGDLLNVALGVGIYATGKVVRTSFICGAIHLIELPIMWLLLIWLKVPAIIYCVHIVVVFIIVFANSAILKIQMPEFSIGRFWLRGVLNPMLILIASYAITFYITDGWILNIPQLILVGIISTTTMAIISWFFAIDSQMRANIKQKIAAKIPRL